MPRRVGSELFVQDKHGVSWLKTASSLFGWLCSTGPVEWHSRTPGCVSKEELFCELRRTATRYIAVEDYPHCPPIDGHYYACKTPTPGDGQALAELLDRFQPDEPIDRDLLQAYVMTVLWGGLPGTRPAFVFSSDAGRGGGKSKAAELLASIVGEVMAVSESETAENFKTRLLSSEGRSKRVVLIDNIKSSKLSWPDIESLITARTISGRELYHGEGSRPNLVTVVLTMNGVNLSRDVAQRSVIVKLSKARYSGTWYEDTVAFIETHRTQIINDIAAAFTSQPRGLGRYSRLATWERAVLERLPDPCDAQLTFIQRQREADVDTEECEMIDEGFAERIADAKYADTDRVFIPMAIAREWLEEITNDRRTTRQAGRLLNQMITEASLPRLVISPSRTYGRGYVWQPTEWSPSEDIRHDLPERLNRSRWWDDD
jgi:hypothetical protein